MVERVLKDSFFWEERGEKVSLCATNLETEKEKWIAPVYTPKNFRGLGFASALVYEVSKRILSKSKTPLLFTDQSNPTSNSIYQKIGYKSLCDFRHIELLGNK